MCDVWYRSIYWRILFGFSAFLAMMLVLQGFLFARLMQDATELPRMAMISGILIGIGTAVVATVLFGTGERRLWELRQASVRVDAGDLTARAPESGVDEVAVVARSFNRLADDLASRARALENSDRVRRQLLADVSHELMTPLTAIRGYIDTLTMDEIPIDAEKRERYFQNLDEETRRLERIIKDLRDLARLEGGGAALEIERVPVTGLFERVFARHEQELSARRIRLVRRVGTDAEFIHGDPDRLEQAIQNLAANALRHTPDGGEISLTAAAMGGTVRLRICDTGPGIPQEHLPLIFDRFYKVESARRGSRGSGLGLSITKAIVERHGGSITASNDAAGGAVFVIDLPDISSANRVASEDGAAYA